VLPIAIIIAVVAWFVKRHRQQGTTSTEVWMIVLILGATLLVGAVAALL